MFHQAPQQRLPKPPPRHERPEGRAVSWYQLDHVQGKATSGTSQVLKIIFFQNPSDSRRVFSEQNEEFLQGSRNVILNLYSFTLRKLWQILQQRHEPETDDFFWEPDRFEPTEQYVSNVNVIAVFSHISCPYISNQCLQSPKSNAFEMLWCISAGISSTEMRSM